jgi:hypothetical protein
MNFQLNKIIKDSFTKFKRYELNLLALILRI